MSKSLSLVITTILIISLLCACGSDAQLYGGESPLPSSLPAESSPDAVSPLPAAAVSQEDARQKELLRSFIDENYDALSAACFGGIAGVGFIDLDLDGCVELLLFDAGASASMGVQFFDVIDGAVECVSANMQPMADTFGGAHLSQSAVNANYYDDFRLMEEAVTGKRFFQVVSFNGAADFSYRELIRFGSDDGALTISPIAFLHEEYDLDSGEITSTEYKLSGASCTEEEYLTALAQMAEDYADKGLDAAGVFAWESSTYTADKTGMLAMTDAALAFSGSNMLPA